MENRILLCGGTTGGHISPILAVVPYLESFQQTKIVCWVGVCRLEENAALKHSISFEKIVSGHFRSGLSFQSLLFPFLFIFGLIQSLFILWKYKPTYTFLTGTYFCMPVAIIARLWGCKVVIHEQTMNIGLANKLCAFFAHKVLLSFGTSYSSIPRLLHKKCVVTGNPIRGSLNCGDLSVKEGILKGMGQYLPILYVSGGSLGREEFTSILSEILISLCGSWNIIYHHGEQSGTGLEHSNYREYDDVSSLLKGIYATADFVISSCGANTINELAFFQLPALLIPLQDSRNNEQFENGLWFVNNHEGILMSSQELNPKSVMNILDAKLISISQKGLRRNNMIALKEDKTALKIAQILLSPLND